MDREALGRTVRDAWVAWAQEQPDPKPSWLTRWDDLDDRQREVDMRIGEAVAAAERERIARAIEASIVDEPPQRYERWPCTCLDGRECFPHAVTRAMNEVTMMCNENTWPVLIASGVWNAIEPLIRRDAAGIARMPASSERLCEAGCGCRYGTDESDRRECGCDGPCCGDDYAIWYGGAESGATRRETS